MTGMNRGAMPETQRNILDEKLLEFTASELFARTFREGMNLVEETAAYLDGPGRADAKTLPRASALVYASQSMRLTTRLMQVASWLLVQRALQEGEMTSDEARQDRYRLSAEMAQDTDQSPETENLPAYLKDLLSRSQTLFDRVSRLDQNLYGPVSVRKSGGIADQMARLESAFGKINPGS